MGRKNAQKERMIAVGVDPGVHIGLGAVEAVGGVAQLRGATEVASDGFFEASAFEWLERALRPYPSAIVVIESLVPHGEAMPKLITRQGSGYSMSQHLIRTERIARTIELVAHFNLLGRVERCTAAEARKAIVGKRAAKDGEVKRALAASMTVAPAGLRWRWNAHSRDGVAAALFALKRCGAL
jgi:hypothetical protein